MNSLCSKRKPFSKLLFSLSSPSARILFSTSSANHSYSSSSSRRHDEESRNVMVSVWWDIENCCVPSEINVFKIAQSIVSAVRVNGIKGPVQISAFGDVFHLPRAIQEALSVTGVNLVHVPNGGKNSADRSILVDLMYWVSQNPPPAHIFLISGDRDFASVLHRLRMSNYNILLAGVPCDTSAVLSSASSIMWNWSDLAQGEKLSGRHFNQPPDGPFNSWYGHYRGPLEDPFEVPSQKNSLKTSDSSSDEETLSDKIYQVPKPVLKQIRQIVNSYPYGVSSTELRARLTKSQVKIDRDFYGYKKFSRLLLSIPHIIKAVPAADGQLILRPAPRVRRPAEINDVLEGFMTENGTHGAQMNAKASDKTHLISKIEPMLHMSASNEVKDKAVEEKMEGTTEKVFDTSVRELQASSTTKLHGEETLDANVIKGPKAEKILGKVSDSTSEDEDASSKELHEKKTSGPQEVDNAMALSDEQNPKTEMGLFRRLWTNWFSSSKDAEEREHDIPSKVHAFSDSTARSTSEEGPSKSVNQYEVHASSLSSSSTRSDVDGNSNIVDKPVVSQGFFSKVMRWFKPGRNESSVDTLPEQSSQEPGLIQDSSQHEDGQNSRKHELFSNESFWSAVESFLKTYVGLRVVMKSTSREDLARRLQKDGPSAVQSLQKSDLLHLVDLLVSEKKWIREHPSQIPCFRLALSHEKSSISSSSSPEPSGVYAIPSKKPSAKTRMEILGDCKKMLNELLQKHPEGFSSGCFRKQFVEKYGYSLDHQKLGYPKLLSLLQIMPGVKIESHKIFPDSVVHDSAILSLGSEAKSSGSDSEMNDLSQKRKDIESPWEELGPVAVDSNPRKQEKRSNQESVNSVYEPCALEDDEFSDQEEEGSSNLTKDEERSRSSVNEDGSSLLQVLDSWYSSKGENSSCAHTSDTKNSEDHPLEKTKPSWSSHIDDKDEVSTTSHHAQKQRTQKVYTFISDSNEKQKEIDQFHAG